MDKDIEEMFKQKNKEILITNLKFDLDKNIDSLLDTITNIYNLEFDTAIKKISAILEDSNIVGNDKEITEIVNNMKLKNYQDIELFIGEKKETLLEKIDLLEFNEDSINKYYDIVFKGTKKLKEKLKKEFDDILNKNIKKFESLINKSKDVENSELTTIRVKDYLVNRLYGKLETKIHMEIMLRDNNLINKAKEVYERYLEITAKTA